MQYFHPYLAIVLTFIALCVPFRRNYHLHRYEMNLFEMITGADHGGWMAASALGALLPLLGALMAHSSNTLVAGPLRRAVGLGAMGFAGALLLALMLFGFGYRASATLDIHVTIFGVPLYYFIAGSFLLLAPSIPSQ
ncbi:MAG: hypothetical protein AAFV53_03470 [Myxococcota bacterium]